MENNGLDGDENVPVKIAQITFAFRNEKVINWLKKRGDAIKKEKWDKLDEVNQEITDNLQDDELINAVQVPCSVFMMFETEEGVTRARQLNE